MTLEADVSDWRVGDEIAIASTGLRHDQGQNEKRTITAVSGNTIDIDPPLDHKHLSISQVKQDLLCFDELNQQGLNKSAKKTKQKKNYGIKEFVDH